MVSEKEHHKFLKNIPNSQHFWNNGVLADQAWYSSVRVFWRWDILFSMNIWVYIGIIVKNWLKKLSLFPYNAHRRHFSLITVPVIFTTSPLSRDRLNHLLQETLLTEVMLYGVGIWRE
jgi:hypothetical protein